MNVIQPSHDIKEEVTACPVDVKEEIPETLNDVKQDVTVKQGKYVESFPVFSFSIPVKQLLHVSDEFSSSDAAEGEVGDKKHLNATPSDCSISREHSLLMETYAGLLTTDVKKEKEEMPICMKEEGNEQRGEYPQVASSRIRGTVSLPAWSKVARNRSVGVLKSEFGMNSTSASSSVKLTRIRSFLKPKSEPEICTPLPSLLSSSNDPARYGSSEKSNSEPAPRFADYMKDQLSELIAHQESLIGEMSFKCTTCEKSFPDQFTFIKHKFREHRQIHKAGSCQTTEVQYKSDPNEKLFTRLSSLSFNKHLLPKQNFSSSNVDNSAQKMFACCVCAECFPDRSGLSKHLLTHPDLEEKPYNCTECDKSFLKKHCLLKHARVHAEEDLEKLKTGDSPFQCFECGKWFTRRSKFNVHKTIHMDSMPYKCFICEKGFITRTEMKKHKWVHVKEKPYKCAKCGKSFSVRYTFINHKRMHSGEKTAACSICGKSYVTVKGLLSHLRIHAGKAPHSCRICGKSFLFRSYLAQHRKVHRGEKPFKCTECGKNFRAKCALKSHEKAHSGEITPAVKYFICTDCGKSFTSYCKLLIHKKKHTGGINGAEISTSG
ncbi:gastrula zinc finger protein XlCGF26.1-like isoform X2 [Protopterus annectens]|uniref:gastrula zinc finger protein XlCGF26.1-like isoform X2 n=1 Tax=Protopterus annectens TaxID=7888 RepID=UPI001CFA7C36|nr:gastrula zinc finger protein XlCGF26.1-like isoform X2 [Protopterus annectens]